MSPFMPHYKECGLWNCDFEQSHLLNGDNEDVLVYFE